MAYVPTLKKMYKEQVVPALVKQFGYSSVMRSPCWRRSSSIRDSVRP